MEAKDLFASLYDNAGFQLQQVFKDIPAGGWDAKVTPSSMSPRETAAHLTEAYTACNKMLKGEEHSWGTFQPASTESDGLLSEMWKEREDAKSAALNANDPTVFKHVLDFS